MRTRREEKETTQWFYLAAVNRLFLPSTASCALPTHAKHHVHNAVKENLQAARRLRSDSPVAGRVVAKTRKPTNKQS